MTCRNLGPDVKLSQHTILDRRVGRRRFVVGSTTMLATLAGVAGSRGTMAQGTVEPARGGRAVIALIQEPGQMNPYFNIQSGSFLSTLVVDPLFVPDANGNYLPVLAPRCRRLKTAASPKTS